MTLFPNRLLSKLPVTRRLHITYLGLSKLSTKEKLHYNSKKQNP